MKTIEALRRLNRDTKAEVYIVGGFVRDLLRNKKNNDLDIVVRGLPLVDIQRFLRRFGKTKLVTLSKTNDLFEVEILLFRAFKDSLEAQITLPRKGKRQVTDPDNTLRDDVKFRDFKLNSMYLPINFKNKKDVIDLVGGKDGIVQRVITANGSSVERIKESPIRMMRAVSLATRTHYNLSKKLAIAIKDSAYLINKCPAEAVRAEFEEILMSSKPSKYFKLLNNLGLLKHIAPEVQACVGVKQDNRYHKYDVFSHLIYTVDHCDEDLVIRLAGLLHDVGKATTKRKVREGNDVRITFHKHEMESTKLARNFLKRFKYDTETARDVLLIVRLHMYHYTRDWTDSAIRKFIKRAGVTEEYLTEEKISQFPLFRLRAAERLGSGFKNIAVTDRQKDFEKKILDVYKVTTGLEIKDLKINGHIIMDTFKIPGGVQIGKILKFLLEKVLEKPELNNELDLLKLTTEFLHQENNSDNS